MTLNLHLDDIHEPSRPLNDVRESTKTSDFAIHGSGKTSSCQQKTKQHIKLFKQYLLTCDQTGMRCALDTDSSSESSENSDDLCATSHIQPCEQADSRKKWRSFLTRHRSWSCNSPLPSQCSSISNDGDSRPRDLSTPSSRVAPSISWRSAGSCPVLVESCPKSDGNAVYRRQIASALKGGRTVWL